MNHFKGRRTRLTSLLVVSLGALAIFVLPGLASARHGSDDGSGSTAAIKSFDPATKTLAISLPDGQTLSGTVTRGTKIRCEDQRGDRRGGHGVRSREAEPGDDRGGHGDEPGDDHGGDSSGPGPSGSGPSGHDDNGSGANCTIADLVPGAAVEEVELKFGADSVRFDEVELANHSS